MSMLVLAGLLGLPVYAVRRMGADFHWLGIYGLAISAVTYWVYAVDKRLAEEGEWRVPENLLHFLEMAGGWPGAFLAHRRLRHKCSKRSYQFMFWLIVLGYQFAAFDFMNHWQYSRATLNWIQKTSPHRR